MKMLRGGHWGVPSCTKKQAKAKPTALDDDELRRRIFGGSLPLASSPLVRPEVDINSAANAVVLFPSSSSSQTIDTYEIIYGSKPRYPSEKQYSPGCSSLTSEEPPWQYALLVRRNQNGDYTALIRGQAWSTTVPWSMVLQGLLDATATAVHRKFGCAQMPPLGVVEELPRYEAPAAETGGRQ